MAVHQGYRTGRLVSLPKLDEFDLRCALTRTGMDRAHGIQDQMVWAQVQIDYLLSTALCSSLALCKAAGYNLAKGPCAAMITKLQGLLARCAPSMP